jgi:hypothetical protein
MIASLGNTQARQLTELYRALRLYVNCFQPSMKLLSKQRDGKKVRCVYDPAKTPLQRLLQSRVLPAQKQQELLEVAQALDPIRLLHQVEQLQQAIFRCAVGCSPFISSLPSAPLRVFSAESSMTGTFPIEGSVPDPTAGLQTLYREQERRKRVLGWRRTHKDPFEGEWEQIMSWVMANPKGAAETFSGSYSAALPDAIKHCKSAPCSATCGKYEPSCWKPLRSNGKMNSSMDHYPHQSHQKRGRPGVHDRQLNTPPSTIFGGAMQLKDQLVRSRDIQTRGKLSQWGLDKRSIFKYIIE